MHGATEGLKKQAIRLPKPTYKPELALWLQVSVDRTLRPELFAMQSSLFFALPLASSTLIFPLVWGARRG
jgi:hypothetical protein